MVGGGDLPGDDKVITIAHAAYCFDDFAFIIFDDFYPLELLGTSEGRTMTWKVVDSYNAEGEAPFGHVCRVGLLSC
jgi:hypothetical protein